MLGLKETKRRPKTSVKHWSDELMEWTGLALLELVRLADEDRNAYRRFAHRVVNRGSLQYLNATLLKVYYAPK